MLRKSKKAWDKEKKENICRKTDKETENALQRLSANDSADDRIFHALVHQFSLSKFSCRSVVSTRYL
jgi:hypothetical protein